MEILTTLFHILCAMAPYILLGFLIAGIMHAFVPTALMSRHLSGTGPRAVAKAAALGVPLPLCSCGVLPTAVALRRGGASRAATTSFLVATPQTGVDSIAATWSLLGPAFAVIRPIAALFTAMFGGIAVGKAENRAPTPADTTAGAACPSAAPEDTRPKGFGPRCVAALRYGFIDLVGSIGLWLIAGLIIAALITVYVPADALALLGDNPLLAMVAVLIIAIPMYVCATGSIPIAMSLMLKGLSPGTAFVLLMAGPAANFASFALISREMGRKAAVIYLGAIVVGAMAFGLAIDYLMPADWFSLPAIGHGAHGHSAPGAFAIICAAVLAALLIITLFINYRHKKITSAMTKEYTVTGMNCPHCAAAVRKAIAAVPGVKEVEVDLAGKKAVVDGTAAANDIAAAVRAAGFDIVLP